MNFQCALILLCNHLIVKSYCQDIDPDTFDFDNFDAYMTTEKFEYSTLDPLSFFPSVESNTELPVEVDTEIPNESSESEINSTQKMPDEKEITTERSAKAENTDSSKVNASEPRANPDSMETKPILTTEASNVLETTKASLPTTTSESVNGILSTTTLETVARKSSTDVTSESLTTTEKISTSTKGFEPPATSTEFPASTMSDNKVETTLPSIETTSITFYSTTQSTLSTSTEMEIESTTLPNLTSTTVSIPPSTLGLKESTADIEISMTTSSSPAFSSTSTEDPKKDEDSTEDLGAMNERETTTENYERIAPHPDNAKDETSTKSTTAEIQYPEINETSTTESVEKLSLTPPQQISTLPIESATDLPSSTTQQSTSENSELSSSTVQSTTTEHITTTLEPISTSITPQSTTILSVTSSTLSASTTNSIKIELSTSTLKTIINAKPSTASPETNNESTVTSGTPIHDGEEFPTLDPLLKIPIDDIPEPMEITTPKLDANNKTPTSEDNGSIEVTTVPVFEKSTKSTLLPTTPQAIMTSTQFGITTQLPDSKIPKPSLEATSPKPDETLSTPEGFPSTKLQTTTPVSEDDELPILEPRFKVPIDMIPEPFELTPPSTSPKESDKTVTFAMPLLHNFDSNVKNTDLESTTPQSVDNYKWTNLERESYPTFNPNFMVPIEESEESVEHTKVDVTVKPYPTFNPFYKITQTDSLQTSSLPNHTFGFKLYPFFQTHSKQPENSITQPTPVYRLDPKLKKPIEDSEKPMFSPRYHIKVMDPTCGCIRRVIGPTPEPAKFYSPVKEHEHSHPIILSRAWESNTKPPGSIYRINIPAQDNVRKISVDELGGILKPMPVPAEVLGAFPNFKAQETLEPTKTQHFHKNYLVPSQSSGFHLVPQGEVRIVTPTIQSPVQVGYKYNLGSSSPTVIKVQEQERPMHFYYKYSPEEGKTKIIVPNMDERQLYPQGAFVKPQPRPILNKEINVENGHRFQQKSTTDGCYYKVEEGPLTMDGDSLYGRLLIAPNRCKRCFYCCPTQRGLRQCSRAKLSECLKRQLVELPGRPVSQPQPTEQTLSSNSPCKLTKTWPDGMSGLPKFKVICS